MSLHSPRLLGEEKKYTASKLHEVRNHRDYYYWDQPRQAQPSARAARASNSREERQRKVPNKDDMFTKMEHSIELKSAQQSSGPNNLRHIKVKSIFCRKGATPLVCLAL